MDKKQLINFLEFKLLDFNKYALTIGDLIIVIFIVVITTYLLKLINSILNRMVINQRLEERNKNSFFALIKYLTWIISIVICLEIIGVKITILLAGSAALLVGLGLGLQQIFSDIVSGIFLMLEGSVKEKDIMEVDGIVGKVLKINLRTSEVLTRTGIIIIVPNHKFITENVVNWSHNATVTRFNVKVGVAYNSNPELVKEILFNCANNHPLVVSEQPNVPFVRLIEFGDSSLDFDLLFWSKEGFVIENIKSDIRFSILSKFRENNIEIPYPQRDVNFRNP